MIKQLSLLFSLVFSILAYDFAPNLEHNRLGAIEVLDVKVLDFKALDGIEFKGISDLAYDKDRGLYALSDFGNLYKLDLVIGKHKIKEVHLAETYTLKNKKGKKLKKKKSDSEGMVFSKEGLIISFERHPKISLFSLKGKKLKNFILNEPLVEIKNYQKKNKALEAVTLHPKFGIITAPEVALKKQDENIHTLYALDKKWKFKASYKITSILLLKDNNILVLERDFSYLKGYSILLKKVDIMECEELCKSTVLADFKSTDGWNLDNFEGLAQVGENLYLMVSDDNGSFLQKTLLVLFRIHE